MEDEDANGAYIWGGDVGAKVRPDMGVAVAYAVNNGKHPLNFTAADITAVQSTLRTSSARLDK